MRIAIGRGMETDVTTDRTGANRSSNTWITTDPFPLFRRITPQATGRAAGMQGPKTETSHRRKIPII